MAGAELRLRGINYDTGFLGESDGTRRAFDPASVRRDMDAIAGSLHAGAVRVTGSQLDRLAIAGRAAVEAGLELWFSPFPSGVGADDAIALLADSAAEAELIRGEGGTVTLVLGCEMSVFCDGFLPGDHLWERIGVLASQPWSEHMVRSFAALPSVLDRELGRALSAARMRFGGPITYASGLWEQVDWSGFDCVGVDLYRDSSNAAAYPDLLRGYLTHGKPVAITEFGCCTYRGAADRGGLGFTVIDWASSPRSLDDEYERAEGEQVGYFTDLYDLFASEGVDAAFWFTFAGFDLPHRDDPKYDLDLASYGAVRVGEDGSTWEPKAVFHAIADAYRRTPT